ncbi:MAG: GTP-binding protein, partial [Candidatus Syntropharchaeia archaeon]
QYFSVVKADWTEVKPITVLFQILRPGGIRIYVLKILITGPYNAGKSSFMHSIATEAVSVDRSASRRYPPPLPLTWDT